MPYPFLSLPEFLRKHYSNLKPFHLKHNERGVLVVEGTPQCNGPFYPTFALRLNGNSKQRRQQRRKFLREVNRG